MGTITKALSLLDFFEPTRPEIGLSEFVALSGRDKATVHRHLVELTENGFLGQNSQTRGYHLGAALLRLSWVREATHPTRMLVAPIVEELANEVGELIHFTMIGKSGLTPVCHSDPQSHGTQVHFDPSRILPFHATSSGLAVMAFAPKTILAKMLGVGCEIFTPHTIVEEARLREAIKAAQQTGVCDMSLGFDPEVCSRAVPIFGADGFAIGALSVATPQTRMTPEMQHTIANILADGVARVTDVLGGHIPENHRSKWVQDPVNLKG